MKLLRLLLHLLLHLLHLIGQLLLRLLIALRSLLHLLSHLRRLLLAHPHLLQFVFNVFLHLRIFPGLLQLLRQLLHVFRSFYFFLFGHLVELFGHLVEVSHGFVEFVVGQIIVDLLHILTLVVAGIPERFGKSFLLLHRLRASFLRLIRQRLLHILQHFRRLAGHAIGIVKLLIFKDIPKRLCLGLQFRILGHVARQGFKGHHRLLDFPLGFIDLLIHLLGLLFFHRLISEQIHRLHPQAKRTGQRDHRERAIAHPGECHGELALQLDVVGRRFGIANRGLGEEILAGPYDEGGAEFFIKLELLIDRHRRIISRRTAKPCRKRNARRHHPTTYHPPLHRGQILIPHDPP